MPQPLDYMAHRPDRRPLFNSTACGSAAIAAIAVAAVNGALYAWAYTERGWAVIPIFGLTIVSDVAMLIIGLALTPTVRRMSFDGRIGVYTFVAVLAPVVCLTAFGWALSAIPPDLRGAP